MTMTRELTIDLRTPAGEPMRGVRVIATLVDPKYGRPALNAVSETLIGSGYRPYTMTDENGHATLSLVPNADMVLESRYRVLIEAYDDDTRHKWGGDTFFILMPDEDVNIASLIVEASAEGADMS